MNNQIKTIKLFRTKDLSLASVLYASDQKLSSIEPIKAGQVFFVFEDGPSCETLIQKHFKNELNLPTRQLLDAVRTLKSIIFNS